MRDNGFSFAFKLKKLLYIPKSYARKLSIVQRSLFFQTHPGGWQGGIFSMSGAPRRRQAIFFLVDTQGANVVGCYRPELALGTPNIDRLAGDGVRFDCGYTCSPVCGPARSALMTGLYPHSNGVLGNDMAPHIDIPTIGQRLEQAGVKTGHVGKWHLDGTDYFGDGRCPPGWDPEFWFDGRKYLESLPNDAARDLSRQVLGPADVARHDITSEFTHAHRSADRAIAFLEKHRDEDFFLVVSIDEPHAPFICPEPFVSAFEAFDFPAPSATDDLAGKPRSQLEWAREMGVQTNPSVIRQPRFFGCNSYSDSQVGRVMEAVDAFAPGAFVTYTSDHGEMMGGHGLWGKGPVVYEEITRVPFIIRHPGVAPAGMASRIPVSHVDLVPTWLDFFGVRIPELLHGSSLLPWMADPTAAVRRRVFMEFNRFEIDHDGYGAFSPIRAVCDGEHKLAINLLDIDEFYDLANDPLEMENRIDSPSSVRDELFEEIVGWMNRTRDPLRGPHWLRRPWRGRVQASSWGGPTRPRPADPAFFPPTLLYDTGRPVDRAVYDKK